MAERKTHRKIFVIGGIVALIMFGFAFAMVPLYSMLCQATGINTSAANGGLLTAVPEKVGSDAVDLNRTVKIQFTAINHNGMPWEFIPRTKSIDVHPGQNNKVFFYAKNPTDKTMTAQAIPGMTPTDAIGFFHKIVCFCFNQQTLKPGESKEMPMIFRIDKELPKEVSVITLQYTLFDATPKETRKG